MDQTDKKILNIIQTEFPIKSRPFLEVAERTGIDEEEVIQRVKNLKSKGLIRRFGGVFDSKKLGFETTLVAAKVEPARVDEVAKRINEYPGVTHNYLRDDYFNLWFTVVAKSKEEIQDILEEMRLLSGVEKLIYLPAEKLYKIGLNLILE